MLLLKEEKDALKLWQPTNSQFVKDTQWVQVNFPSKVTVNDFTSNFFNLTYNDTLLSRKYSSPR